MDFSLYDDDEKAIHIFEFLSFPRLAEVQHGDAVKSAMRSQTKQSSTVYYVASVFWMYNEQIKQAKLSFYVCLMYFHIALG